MVPRLLNVAILYLGLLAVPVARASKTQVPAIDRLNAKLKELGFQDLPQRFAKASDTQNYNQSQRCSFSCEALDFFTLQAALPSTGNYNQEKQNYWSLQQRVSPACFYLPTSAQEVAVAVVLSQFAQCPFSVKSGGHAAFKGASNIPGGITIDLLKLNEIAVSSDRTTTRIGPGNRWVDVYTKLTPLNLTVIGGRVSGIGVGGLTLGGGVSFFSGRHGWACDNVKNYEIVLANGQIANINYTSAPDLYHALRGGGNNFGIVTRFDLATYPQGLMYGGMINWPISANESVLNAFNDFALNSSKDPDAAVITSFAFAQGAYFAAVDLEHATPIDSPPIFKDFLAISGKLQDTTRITTLPNITDEFEAVNPVGLREMYITATFYPDRQLEAYILDTFIEEVKKIADVPGYLPAVTYQSISTIEIQHFSKNGGNALGLSKVKGPLLLVNLSIMWFNQTDDSRVIATTYKILNRSIAYAKKRDLFEPYIYQNYAYKGQQVFQGYGNESVVALVAASKKYDPNGVFQKLQPGYFKLPM